MVEAAFVIPVMLLIFFGLTQLAFGMSASSSATGASRTGARLAAATYAPAARGGVPAQLEANIDSIRLGVERDLEGRPAQTTPVRLEVYRAALTGRPASGAACSTDCISWTWNGTAFANRTGSWPSPDACGSTVDLVGVRVTLDHEINSPFLGDIEVQRATTMRLEPITDVAC
jgi:hypothetical protein